MSVDNEDEVQPSDNDEEANSASNVASTKADKKRKKKKAKKQKAEKIENKLSEPGVSVRIQYSYICFCRNIPHLKWCVH